MINNQHWHVHWTQKGHRHNQDYYHNTFCQFWETKDQEPMTRNEIHMCYKDSNLTITPKDQTFRRDRRRHLAKEQGSDNIGESEMRRSTELLQEISRRPPNNDLHNPWRARNRTVYHTRLHTTVHSLSPCQKDRWSSPDLSGIGSASPRRRRGPGNQPPSEEAT